MKIASILTHTLLWGSCVAQSQPNENLRALNPKNGWTRYVCDFRIELPPIFGTVFEDDYGWGFLSRDSLTQSVLKHDIALYVRSVGSNDFVDRSIAEKWEDSKLAIENQIQDTSSTVVFSKIGLKKCKALTYSGYGDSASYTYEEFIKRKDNVMDLSIFFDSNDKTFMDAVLPRIASSFR